MNRGGGGGVPEKEDGKQQETLRQSIPLHRNTYHKNNNRMV